LKTFIEFEKLLAQINENNFEEIAWRLFHFQAAHNEVYRNYLAHLRIDPLKLKSLHEIPFLPISFFKSHAIKTGDWSTQRIYQSSGTTQSIRSVHHLWDEPFYLNHAERCFEKFVGPLDQFHILALLPSYDTANSSLVAMVRYFIAKSKSHHSCFLLSNTNRNAIEFERIADLIDQLSQSDKKVLLLGVSHGLLDLADNGPFSIKNILVMETGGMKGRKEEITREELHGKIRNGLGVKEIYSEYGMTELCSQAYSLSEGIFECSPAMRVIIKEVNDPFSLAQNTGIINVIDLANFHSCGFIETQDLGRVTSHGFQVLGRADNSEARGCNLLMV
jgi:Acyl-protein synthetase, LuxE